MSSTHVARALIGLAVLSCGSHDPSDMSVLVPEGSIYTEPAEQVRKLGYTIIYVDTNIGMLEGLRWRERRVATRSGIVSGRADYLIVDVYEDVDTGRVVVSVIGQTVRVTYSVGDIHPYSMRAAGPPSTTVRRHAEALLTALGCKQVRSEQRLTGVYGPQVEVTCEDSDG